MQCPVKDVAVQIGASGAGLEKAIVGQPVTFVVETKGATDADLTADVTCKQFKAFQNLPGSVWSPISP